MYESSADRDNERDVIERAWERWPGMVITRLPRAYPVDYWASLDERSAFVEIKCRNYTMQRLNEIGGVIISLQKWVTARALSAAAGVPLKVWVRTSDGYWQHTTMDFLHDGVRIAGRSDRGDAEDIEPCITLRAGNFFRFGVRT
jgi:hypothetical protein